MMSITRSRFLPLHPLTSVVLGLPLLAALLACNMAPTTPAGGTTSTSTAAPTTTPINVGGDRDEHGCIASAGYQWCAKTNSCVRPWELAAERGFKNTPEAFAQYCAAVK